MFLSKKDTTKVKLKNFNNEISSVPLIKEKMKLFTLSVNVESTVLFEITESLFITELNKDPIIHNDNPFVRTYKIDAINEIKT